MAELAVCPHVFTFISLPHLGAWLDNSRCRKKGAFAKSHGPASKCLHKRVLSQFWLHFCENWCFNHHLSCYDNHLQTSRLKQSFFSSFMVLWGGLFNWAALLVSLMQLGPESLQIHLGCWDGWVSLLHVAFRTLLQVVCTAISPAG